MFLLFKLFYDLSTVHILFILSYMDRIIAH